MGINFRLSVMEVVRVGEEVEIKSNGVENEEGQEYSEVLGGVHCHLHRHHPLYFRNSLTNLLLIGFVGPVGY